MNAQGYTLANVKSRAKQIKKQEGITHIEALNKVAVKLGYQNYTHCQRELSTIK